MINLFLKRSFSSLLPGVQRTHDCVQKSCLRVLSPLIALAIIGTAVPTPAFAQQAAVPPAGYKDPGTATIIGLFVPGGGQLWVGGEAQKRGIVLLGIGYGSLFAGPILGASSGSTAPAFLGLIGYLGATVYGALTADDAAGVHNRQLGGRAAILKRVQPVIAPGNEGTRVGLTVRF